MDNYMFIFLKIQMRRLNYQINVKYVDWYKRNRIFEKDNNN